ncbi:sortase domain-bontaining protein [Solicola sp. PLA-1-18]|uniref:sortase domain-containing protein n=1 Tax=Solicola sp. PLA-1-18 TaxID=3380532 RepID=UPI003B7C9ECE
MRRSWGTVTAGAAACALLAACAPAEREVARDEVPAPSATTTAPTTPPTTAPPTTPATTAAPAVAGPVPSDGAPARARIRVRSAGVDDLVVVPYEGRTDDAVGTRIQDGGVAASPHGPEGGVGPGGIGNYQVTAHRLSSTKAFLDLPDTDVGDQVAVESGGTTYVYRITETRRTSFRSPASLAAQRAAVPGRPGVEPTRAMITLSTCATPEDHAEGNYWSDEFKNPEHRIDKIGVLVRTTPA